MSGSTIGSVVGAGIGFLVGGPAGARFGWMIGGAIGGYIDPDVIKGPRLEGAQPQLSNEGAPRPLVYGRAAISGNIIQTGELVEHKKRQRTGKGGGPVQETYTYTRDVAIRICEAAPLGGEFRLMRVWMNDKLVYSVSGGIAADSAKFASAMRFYSGSETQLPDPTLEALPAARGGGAGNVPAYRGTCYVVFAALDTTDFGGAVPQFKFEISSCGTFNADPCITELVSADATYKFKEVNAGDSTDYSAASFDDSSWGTGDSPFGGWEAGYGAPEIALGAPTGWLGAPDVDDRLPSAFATTWLNNKRMWVRIKLDLPYGAPNPVTITCYIENNCKVWVNDAVVLETPIADGSGFLQEIVLPAGLPAGETVIAVRCDDEAPTSSSSLTYFAMIVETQCGSGIEIPDSPGYYYDRATGLVSGPGVGSVDPCVVTLDEVIGDLTERGGVTDYAVSALASDVVLGYPILQQTSAAGAIRATQSVYFWDYPEFGNSGDITTTLTAVKRGGNSVWSLDHDDMVDFEEVETRAQAVEFPRKVNFISLSPDANYNPIKQTAERESENVKAIGETNIETPIIFERDAAASRAEIALRVMWEEATGRAEVQVPEEFTRFTTSDCGTYAGKRWRIDKISTEDGISTWSLTRDRVSAYVSTALGADSIIPQAAVSSMRGPTMFAAMNLPRIRSEDSSPGMYIAVAGLMDGWAGCDLYMSTDGGVTEQKVATLIDPAVMGVLTAGVTDSGEPLSVDLYDGEVESATPAQIAARENAAAVFENGTAGPCEVLQFEDAVQIDNLADLTTLHRGQLGTTAAAHIAGDSFVVLDASVYFLRIDLAFAGSDLIFRPVSRGTVPANNRTYTVTFSPLFTGPEVEDGTIIDGGDIG